MSSATIAFTTGDILEADADALVNTVNCVGVMGRGIALQFKNAYPDNFAAYAAACSRGDVRPGRMFVYETGGLGRPRYIVNFPTKRHWKGNSRLEDIDSGLRALVAVIKELDIRSIAIPPLGSGLGGLAWTAVRPRIESALGSLNGVDVQIFEPSDVPVVTRSRAVPAMTAGRAALVALMQRYLEGLMEPFVTLLEVHKLLYFMQEAGERLQLAYEKAAYGPYAKNLRHVLNAVEGHLVSGYSDGGDAPEKRLELVPGAIGDAEAYLHDKRDTLDRFTRVVALVDGFESPYGLELLSTVHWVATREGATDAVSAAAMVYAWSERKRRFSEQQIDLAYQTLRSNGWLTSRLH